MEGHIYICEQGLHPKVFIIYSFIYIHFTGKTEKLLRFLNMITRFRMKFILDHVRDWSLITRRGGYKTGGGGGTRSFTPTKRGGAEKVLAMLKGGHKKFWGRFYAVA